jgi:hypothetical protein
MKNVAVVAVVILAALAAPQAWGQTYYWPQSVPRCNSIVDLGYPFVFVPFDVEKYRDTRYLKYSALARLIKPGMTVRQLELVLPPSSPWAEWDFTCAFFGSSLILTSADVAKNWFRYALDDCYSVEEDVEPSGHVLPGRVAGPPRIVFSDRDSDLEKRFWGAPFRFGSPFPRDLQDASPVPRPVISFTWDPSRRPDTLPIMVSPDESISGTSVVHPIPVDDMDLSLPSRDAALLAEARKIRDWFALLEPGLAMTWEGLFLSYPWCYPQPDEDPLISSPLNTDEYMARLRNGPSVFDSIWLAPPKVMPLWLERPKPIYYSSGVTVS